MPPNKTCETLNVTAVQGRESMPSRYTVGILSPSSLYFTITQAILQNPTAACDTAMGGLNLDRALRSAYAEVA